MDPISAPGTDGSSPRPPADSGSPTTAAGSSAADRDALGVSAIDTELPPYTGPDTFGKAVIWGLILIMRWVVPRGKALHGAAFVTIVILAVGVVAVGLEMAIRGTLMTLVHQVHAPGGSAYRYVASGLGGGGTLVGVWRLLKLRRRTRPAGTDQPTEPLTIPGQRNAPPPEPEPVAASAPRTRPAAEVEVEPPRSREPQRRRPPRRRRGGGGTPPPGQDD